jgi:hypothetical protein
MMGIYVASNDASFWQWNVGEALWDGVEVRCAFKFIINIEDRDWYN